MTLPLWLLFPSSFFFLLHPISTINYYARNERFLFSKGYPYKDNNDNNNNNNNYNNNWKRNYVSHNDRKHTY